MMLTDDEFYSAVSSSMRVDDSNDLSYQGRNKDISCLDFSCLGFEVPACPKSGKYCQLDGAAKVYSGEGYALSVGDWQKILAYTKLVATIISDESNTELIIFRGFEFEDFTEAFCPAVLLPELVKRLSRLHGFDDHCELRCEPFCTDAHENLADSVLGVSEVAVSSDVAQTWFAENVKTVLDLRGPILCLSS